MTLSERPYTGVIIPVKDELESNYFEMTDSYRAKRTNTVAGKILLKLIDNFNDGLTKKGPGSTGGGKLAGQ